MVAGVDKFYVVYFIFHVFVTLLVDVTLCLPVWLQHSVQRWLGELHVRSNKDLLAAKPPVWLQAFVWVELFLQTPFFIWAAWELAKGRKRVYPAVLVYATEAAITTYACLAEVCFLDSLTPQERLKLFLVYLPTFLIPCYMLFDFYCRIVGSNKKLVKTD